MPSPPNPRALNGGWLHTWQNLGDWSTVETYVEAATALADRLGRRLKLAPDDVVLDVGCGCGDQLLMWRRRFGVARVVGLEPHPKSARRAQTRTAGEPRIDVYAGAAASEVPVTPTTVVSLDAAYHFRTRADFFRWAAGLLGPGGRLGLTDLFVPDTGADPRARLFAAAAGIPQANLWSLERWRQELAATGFRLVGDENLTRPVFLGFSQFISTRWQPPPRTTTFERIQIRGTARAVGHAADHGWMGYHLVIAERLSGSS